MGFYGNIVEMYWLIDLDTNGEIVDFTVDNATTD